MIRLDWIPSYSGIARNCISPSSSGSQKILPATSEISYLEEDEKKHLNTSFLNVPPLADEGLITPVLTPLDILGKYRKRNKAPNHIGDSLSALCQK